MKRLLALLLFLSLPAQAEIVSNGTSGGGGGGSGTVTSVATNNGLTGGTITTTGTLGLASISNNGALCNNSGSSGAPTTANCTVTGTGNLVLATAPTFVTSITDPLHIGGTGTSSTLTLESTSGVGATDSILFKTGSQSTAMTIATDQGVTLGSPTGGDKGAGTLNVAGNLYVNGTAVNTSSANVNSITGDGALINNSASTGAVTLTLTNATAKSLFGNTSSSSGAPGYQTSPIVSGSLTANTLVSTVSTGTAPLTVTSTTNVANLNASSLTGDVVGTSGATIPLLNSTNTWSGPQTYTNSDLLLLGSSTGATTFTSDNAGASNFTMHVPGANDTFVGKATTDILTNKTLDTAGTGNVFKINGTTVSSVQGNSSKVQLSTGTTTTNDCVKYDVNGNTVDSGAACGGSITLLKQQNFTTSGTFTSDTTANNPLYKITIVGAGGGGGGTAAVPTVGTLNGGGGGGGGTCIVYTTLTSNTAYTVTVGAGGNGGVAGTNNGSAGGDSTVVIGATTYGTSNGAAGGTGQAAASGGAPGGAGGLSTNCSVNIQGSRGLFGNSATINTISLCGAQGGSSTMGGASREQCNSTGFAGSNFGGGGGGGADETGSNRAGGAGAGGIVIFEWVD